ncbi:MAG: type II secretion system F family protein [Emcibacter sp.]|nr:type II secretion system F family protein [Emcibacter sp.]
MFKEWFEEVSDIILKNGDVLVLVIVFLVTAMIILTLANLLDNKPSLKKRLDPLSRQHTSHTDSFSLMEDHQSFFWNDFMSRLQKRGFPNNAEDISMLKLRMIQAGYTHSAAGQIYYILRILLAIGLPMIFLLISPFLSRSVEVGTLTYLVFMLGLIGMYLPFYWVRYQVFIRQRQILDSFPDTLDLFVVCVEAGLGLDAAITRVGIQIGKAHPVLSSELAMVALELRAGRSREDALRNLADRTGVQEVQSLVTLLIQTERLGSSISGSLRVYSSELRLKRTQKAEEKAHMLPVLLSIPLVAFILPTMITVIMLPGIINIIRNITPLLQVGGAS